MVTGQGVGRAVCHNWVSEVNLRRVMASWGRRGALTPLPSHQSYEGY